MGFQARTTEEIQALDNDALKAALDEALAAGEELSKIDDAELSDEQIEELDQINAFAEAVSNESATREAAAAERSEKIASLRESLAAKTRKDEDEDEAPAEDAPAEDAPAEDVVVEDVVPVEEVIPEIPAENPEDDEEDEKKAASAVTASATPKAKGSLASRAARKAPKMTETEATPAFSLTAAADVPGFSSGQKFANLSEAGGAIMAKLNALPKNAPEGTFTRTGAVRIIGGDAKLTQAEFRNDTELFLAAAQEARLPEGNLVAAGGWGAPSETLLDFCKIETTDGTLSLPEVTITRGGINFTKGPSFADVLNSDTGFWDMTEATAEAGVEQKTSLRPEVPAFQEKRLDAVGYMIEAGLLLRSSWPELIQRYAELAVVAHAHKLSNKKLAGILEYTGAAKDVSGGFGNSLDLLNGLELVAAGERQRFAMGDNETMEVILPAWVHAVIRADLANRNGVDYLKVTDAEINSMFAARKLAPQFIRGLQPIAIDEATGIAQGYHANAEAVMYPAGTYVAGVQDVITIDTVYDSTNLKKNDYVHIFTEQGLAVVNPCNEGRYLSIPFAANGRTGAADLTADLYAAAEPAA